MDSSTEARHNIIAKGLSAYYSRSAIANMPIKALTLFSDAAWLITQGIATVSAVTNQLANIVANFPNSPSISSSGFIEYVNAAYQVGGQEKERSCFFLSEFRNFNISIDNQSTWNKFISDGVKENYFNTWTTSSTFSNLDSWSNKFGFGNVLVMQGDANNNFFSGGKEQDIYYIDIDRNFGSDTISEESSFSKNDTVFLHTEFENPNSFASKMMNDLSFARNDAGDLLLKVGNSQVALKYQFNAYDGYKIENIFFGNISTTYSLNVSQLINAMNQIGGNDAKTIAQLNTVSSPLAWSIV